MRKSKLISRAMFIGGTVALLAGPAWSQEAVGERHQPDKTLTRPGGSKNIPGMQQGTVELSKDDMRKVEEGVKSQGRPPGKRLTVSLMTRTEPLSAPSKRTKLFRSRELSIAGLPKSLA